jgi:hypothetical protein
MPDPALMHGRAIPAPELATGTITVRVVRESLGNNVQGQAVTVSVAGATRSATTDDQGRAEFSNLPAGSVATAGAIVDGESLASEPFTVPASGGLRLILVAGLGGVADAGVADGADAAAPPVAGTVVFGGDSRVLMEFRDDVLQVYYVLNVMNAAGSHVDIGGPLIIELPTGAAGTTILEGSTPTASAAGERVTVTGPFAPGSTLVQVGYQLRYDDREVIIEQPLPAALEQLTVAMERVGEATMRSTQFNETTEVRANDGTPYMMARGPGLPAGATFSVQLANLPVHSRVPRYVALSLAGAALLAGLWLMLGTRGAAVDTQRKLAERRDTLLGEVAQLERRSRAGGGLEPKLAARRQRLLAELERVYGELDQEGAPIETPAGARRGAPGRAEG